MAVHRDGQICQESVNSKGVGCRRCNAKQNTVTHYLESYVTAIAGLGLVSKRVRTSLPENKKGAKG